MKKIKLLLALLVLVLVTGCGSSNKVVKCKSSIKNDNVDYSATYEITLLDDEYVKSVKTTEVLKSSSKEYLETAKSSVEELYSSADKEYGGYTYSVKIDGDTLTATCTIDYEKMDIEKYVEDNPGLTNFSDGKKVKLEGVTEIYEQVGAKCEK